VVGPRARYPVARAPLGIAAAAAGVLGTVIHRLEPQGEEGLTLLAEPVGDRRKAQRAAAGT
jgi:hypothetical protein